jgi:4-amino-4-deoxy-L-arabinose transferase-like glycosyltransferase
MLSLPKYFYQIVPSLQHVLTAIFNNNTRTIVMLSILAATVVRIWYAHLQVVDFWGDSYHHWLISRLILANNWVYTDYKGMETIWLPAYHYFVSIVMLLWQRFDLAPAYLINSLLGTLTCGLAAWLVAKVSKNGWAGLVAGLTLAMLPWHVAYSHINMPEVASGLFLLLCFALARDGRYVWLILFAFISGLTRHELSFILAILGGWLLWQRQWRVVFGLGFGVLLALITWSTWSWFITGDALAWWTRSQVAAAWDAQFGIEAGIRPIVDFNRLKDTLLQIYPPLYVTGIALLLGFTYKSWCARLTNSGWLLATLVAVHWLFLSFFMVRHLPSLDPRFFLISLPLLVCVGSLVIAANPRRKTRGVFWGLHLVLLLFSLGQLPAFAKKAYVLTPERVAGEHLGAIASEKGNFWVDMPTSIYYSGLSPERFLSSDQLLPDDKRWIENTPELALAAIEQNDIRYILWQEVSYSFVGQVWPMMGAGQAFEQNAYRFVPVFHYSGWELKYGAKPTVLWEVQKK